MSLPVQVETVQVSSARPGGGVREVSLLAFPVVLQTISETVMQVIDSAMVGRLGATELGAVGLSAVWMWTVFVPFIGTSNGVQVFVARHFGAGQPGECGSWVWHALWLLIPGVILWCAAVWLLYPTLIGWIGASPGLQEHAIVYAYARIPQAPATVVGFAITSFFRGVGDTRTPLGATVGAILLNVVLAYGLIFGELGLPRWGVFGAGVAMTVAGWFYAILMTVFFLRREVRRRYRTLPVRPDVRATRRFLWTGAPVGGQWLLDMVSFALFSSIVARMGDVSMAASHAMLQLLSLSFMQAVAISVAAATLVGQYIGSRNLPAAEQSYRSALKLGFGLAAIIAVLFVSIPDMLLGIFTTDTEVLELGRPLLALGAFFQLVDAIAIITGGSLRGAGDTRWSFVVSASFAWLLRLPLVYLAAILLEGGVLGAWLAELAFVSALCGAFVLRFRAGHWRTIEI
jgi:MATE family multidrug resistance protein